MPTSEPRCIVHGRKQGNTQNPIRIHLVLKNAHSAIANSFAQVHHEKKDTRDFCSTFNQGADRMMVVRHPADRAVSAWGFFCWKNPEGNMHDFMEKIGYRKRMCWDDFFEVYINNFRLDNHTRPQVDYLAGQSIKHLIPIEKLNDWWQDHRNYYGLPTLSHTNRSNHDPWTEVVDSTQLKAIEEMLKSDVELYRRSNYAPK